MGWGGVGHVFINIHVNLHMKEMLRCGCRLGHVFVGGEWGGAGHVLRFM